MRRRTDLVLVVLILLIQMALRSHQIDRIPAFIDEYRHVDRAGRLIHLAENPVNDSHGKLLLYAYLGLFVPERTEAGLITARLAVALFALLTTTITAVIAYRLFGRRAALAAAAFYAVAPYPIFFERLAIADPVATGLAALVAWQSLDLARHPTRRRGAITGLLVALASLAKLTTALVATVPVLAAMLYGGPIPAAWSRQALADWLRAGWRRYREAAIAAAAVGGVIWALVLLGALIGLLSGDKPILLDTYLANTPDVERPLGSRVLNTGIILGLMLSAPMIPLLIALPVLLLLHRPRPTLFTLGWLASLSVPIMLFTSMPRARYMVIGVPTLAVLFGGGLALAADRLARRRSRRSAAALAGLLAGVLIWWLVGFVRPFHTALFTDPTRLSLHKLDRMNYFYGSANAWGSREALAYLDAHGERTPGGQIPIHAILLYCDPAAMYLTPDMAWDCVNVVEFDEDRVYPALFSWGALTRAFPDTPFVYVITEYTLDEWPPYNPPLRWEPVFAYDKPYQEGPVVTVWKVTRQPPAASDPP